MANLNDSKNEREKQMLVWTKRLAKFTGALFVATFLSDAIVAYDVIDKNHNQTTVEDQLRAYFALNGINVINGYNPKEHQFGFVFNPAIQNLGGTRAEHVTATISIKYFPGREPNNLDLSKPFEPVHVLPTVVGPQANIPFSPVGINASDVEDAAANKGVILFWGEVEYYTI